MAADPSYRETLVRSIVASGVNRAAAEETADAILRERADELFRRLKREKGWTFGPLPVPTLRSRLRRWLGRKVRHSGSNPRRADRGGQR